jgi:hypothetical protein
MNVITVTPSGQIISSTILSDGSNINVTSSNPLTTNVTTIAGDSDTVFVSGYNSPTNNILVSSSYDQFSLAITTSDATTPSVLTINEGQQGPPGVDGNDGQDGIVSVQNYGSNRVLTALSEETAIYANSELLFDGSILTINNIAVSLSGHIHSSFNDIEQALSEIHTISDKCDTKYVIIQDTFLNFKKLDIQNLMSAVVEVDGGGVINNICQ